MRLERVTSPPVASSQRMATLGMESGQGTSPTTPPDAGAPAQASSVVSAASAPHSSPGAVYISGIDPQLGTVDVMLVSGQRITLSLKEAVQQGLVDIDDQKRPRLTDAGRAAFAGAAAPAAGTAAPTAPPATAQTSDTPGKETPEPNAAKASETLGTMGSNVLLARNLIQVATATKMPHPLTLYFLASGLDRVTGHQVLPGALQNGKPLRDLADFGLIGYMGYESLKEIPGAISTLKASMAAQRSAEVAAGAAAPKGSMLKALVTRIKDEPPAPPATPQTAAAKQTAAAPPTSAPVPPTTLAAGTPAASASNTPTTVAKPTGWLAGMKGLAGIVTPLYYAGFTLISASDILNFTERVREKGTHGMLRSTEGRGALFGALSGALTIASLYIPKSPLSVFSDVGSMAFWLAQAVNDKGWLDPVLGGDPKKPETTT